MENLLVEQKNSFNFLLKKMSKNIINSNNHIDLSNIKIGLMIDDVLEAIKKIPDKNISTVVTSPPYWNLRDYKDNRQIGNEKNPLEFVNKIALVGKEILRILKDDGAYFLNIGDTYVDQSLQMIPQKIAIKMQEQGWLIRNQIIWYKPNHMPSPVRINKIYVITRDDQFRYYIDLDMLPQVRLYFRYGNVLAKIGRATTKILTGESFGFDFRLYFGSMVEEVSLQPFVKLAYNVALGNYHNYKKVEAVKDMR